MLLSRIQRDLFDFTDKDPEDFAGLVEFWYQSNGDALSAALAVQPGFSVIVNVSDFETFERLSKRLFLVADTLILRDTRSWAPGTAEYQDMPIPISGYKPGYVDELLEQLKTLRPSPLTLGYRPASYLTSTHKQLNNGYRAVYVGGVRHRIPRAFVEWIAGRGRQYLNTGKIVYAPFIPPLDMEFDFLRQGVSLPDYFNATPLFHQNYDWLSENQTYSLLQLKIPFLDGLDIETISKVKEEYQDEFTAFSRSLLESVSGIQSTFGTEAFVRDARAIQRNQVDAALGDISKTVRRIESSRSLRKAGILTGLVGLNGAALLGIPEAALATGFATASAAMVMEKVAELKEQGDLRDKKGYFLWKLKEVAKK
jgi:hypothetical protein